MAIDNNQLLGKKLGNCVLERLLGYGGMGAVYLAQQSRPRRTVAVKVLIPGLLPKTEGAYAEFLARFRREADAIAALDHVNIIPIYEYGEQEQIAYLVMPYVTGGTLRDRIVQRGKLPLHEVIPIMEQTAAALDYAHAHGIVHRDLKPGNILFHADGRLLLTDFGIAKVVSNDPFTDHTSAHTLTTAGTIIGTPEYLSPEQATASPVDRRSDVYSLGIVLFQLLSGHVPFTGPTAVAIALKHAMEEPPSLSQLNPTLPASIEKVVGKAIAKRPEDRYAAAGDLAHALAAASEVHDAHPPDFFTEKTAKEEDIVPVVLKSEKKIAEVPAVAEDEAVRVQTSRTPRPQEELDKALTVPLTEPPQRRAGRSASGMAILRWMLVLLLILGGSALYLHWSQDQRQAPAAAGEHQPISPSTTRVATAATSSPTTLPKPAVPVGRLLYGTSLPACDPQQSSLWNPNSNAHITCAPSAMQLTNKAGGNMAGVFLNNLPGGAPIPDNYVLEVQVSENSSSQGMFGIFFRTQIGQNHPGAFSFLMNPSGSWTGNIYDDTTGQARQLYGRQSPALNANGFTTIDIVVEGSTFSLYFNGIRQGAITSLNYPSGNLGLVAVQGTEVQFKNLAIYALPA